MEPLTVEQVVDRFYEPGNLLDAVDTLIDQQHLADFFNKGSPDFHLLRNGWGAAVFGMGYSFFLKPCRVCVTGSQMESSDFFVDVNGNKYGFQFPEGLDPTSKRGEKYKKLKIQPFMLTPYRPERGTQEGSDWVFKAVKRKVDKNYSGSTNLNLLVI